MPRLDRVLTFYLCAPLWRLFAGNRGKSVPILTYHSISDNLFGYSHPYYQINTSPAIFVQQMKWLRNAGYRTVDLHDLPALFASGGDLSYRFVVTFDGGYRDIWNEGWPVMHQCGFSATVFLTTDRIRTSSLRFEGADYMTWQDVRELHSQGVSFGSRTVSHPDLRSLEPEEIDYELGYSKESIEQRLGAPIRSFSYPFSFPEEDKHFTHYLSDALENHGFEIGVSNVIGRASPEKHCFFLPRLPINSWDDSDLLAAKMNGGYDWMHLPQWLHKRLHHNATMMQRASEQSLADSGK
jgi:peptidoglycan/xylan/chitin deacetylase (PgdA/CDA1 family)